MTEPILPQPADLEQYPAKTVGAVLATTQFNDDGIGGGL